MADSDHLSLGRIAKMCNVSRTTVYRWIINKQLDAYTLPSGHFRVRPADLSVFCSNFGIPDPQGEVATVEPATAVAEGGFRVLIADDHPDMQLVLGKVVERYLPDAEVLTSSNGVDTCIQVGTKRPDILLLDIMMPGMDGFAVLQELLCRDELAASSVIIVTAYEPFERIRDLERQYDQVVASFRKPVSVEPLGDALGRLARTEES